MLTHIILWITVSIVHLEAGCLRWNNTNKIKNACFTSNKGPLETLTVKSIKRCALSCIMNENMVCGGANYIDEFSRCELFESDDQLTVLDQCTGHYLIPVRQDQATDEDYGNLPQINGVSTDGCSVGWTRFGDHCYRVETGARTFIQADRRCQGRDAALVSIHSAEENQFITWLARKRLHGFSSVYLGLIKHGGNIANPRMLWTDSTQYNFKQWKSGQPDRNPKDAVCVVMDTKDGTWSDESCRAVLPYICKQIHG